MYMRERRDAVIVTGSGGSGCGRAIALRFAAAGAPVLVSDIDDVGGDETVGLIDKAGGRAMYCRCDVRDETDVANVLAVCEDAFGPLSVLVNNASMADSSAGGLDGW